MENVFSLRVGPVFVQEDGYLVEGGCRSGKALTPLLGSCSLVLPVEVASAAHLSSGFGCAALSSPRLDLSNACEMRC